MTETKIAPNPAPVEGRNAAPDWWRDAVFYQIYPRSFADANGDGLGDLAGVRSKLDYLQELGIDAIWFSPFYPSPQHDHGYDVADYHDINPEYGTLEEAEELISEIHKRGMRVLIDVVPNHSSFEHELFQAALNAEPHSPERAMYIFRHSDDGPPNNWGSMFGGPAWSKVEELTGKESDKDWWYLHLFDPSQPDFDWDNPAVRDFFDDYLRFWCDRGVDGFRVDVAHGLIKADGLPDDDVGPERHEWVDPDGDGSMGKAPDVGPFFDQPEVHDVYRRWRKVLDEYGGDRMMVAEAWSTSPELLSLYVRPDEMNQSFNFDVLKCGWNSGELRETVRKTREANSLVGAVNTWVLSNHDVVRAASRFGVPFGADLDTGLGPAEARPDLEMGLRRANSLMLFLMGLPGAVYVYNGEELGLPEVQEIPDDARTDPTWERTGRRIYGRDGCRVPLPWASTEPNAGFGPDGKPWLPQPDYWVDYAADLQEDDPASELNWYRRMISLRKELEPGSGDLEFVSGHDDLILVRNGDLGVAINMGYTARKLPFEGEVLITSERDPETQDKAVVVEGESITLKPNSAAWIGLK